MKRIYLFLLFAISLLFFSPPFHAESALRSVQESTGITNGDSPPVQTALCPTCINPTTADTTIHGTLTGQRIGQSLTVGNVGGGSKDDLVIGAPSVAKVYVFFGGKPGGVDPSATHPSSLDVTTADVVLIPPTDSASGCFGDAVTITDLNGDGVNDLVITGSDIGEVYIKLGPLSSGTINTYQSKFTAPANSGYAKFSLAGGLDLNKDNVKDLAIGDPLADSNGTDSGSVYIIFGNPYGPDGTSGNSDDKTLPPVLSYNVLLKGAAGDQAGYTLVMGDLQTKTGESYADLAIGAPLLSDTSSKGTIYLLYDRSTWSSPIILSTGSDTKIVGASSGDHIGDGSLAIGPNPRGVAAANSDLLIGVPDADTVRGKAYLIHNFGATTPPTFDLTSATGVTVFTGAINGDQFGYSVDLGSDADGDTSETIPDILIGAPNAANNEAEVGAGRVYLFKGKAFTSPVSVSSADFAFEGLDNASSGIPSSSDDQAGKVVKIRGNFDSDVLSEIVISAPGAEVASPGNSDDKGQVYVHSVAPTGDTTAPGMPTITSPAVGSNVNASTVSFEGTKDTSENNRVDVEETALLCSSTSDTLSSWSCSGVGLVEGSHTVKAKAVDGAIPPNASGYTSPKQFTVDLTDPDTAISGGPIGWINVTSTGFAYSGSDSCCSAGSSLVYSKRLTPPGGAWSPFDASTSQNYSGLVHGTSYTFEVKSKDLSGRADPTPASRNFSVDTQIPGVPGTPTAGPTGCTGVTVNWSAASDANSGIKNYDLYQDTNQNFPFPTFVATVTGTSHTYYGVDSSTHYYKVRSRDNAGNVGNLSLVSDGATGGTSCSSGATGGGGTPIDGGDVDGYTAAMPKGGSGGGPGSPGGPGGGGDGGGGSCNGYYGDYKNNGGWWYGCSPCGLPDCDEGYDW